MPILIFKPNQDLTPIQHLTLHGETAHQEIDEDTSDEDASYIYQFINKTESKAISSFNFHSLSSLPTNITINRASLIIVSKGTGENTAQIYLNGGLKFDTEEILSQEQQVTNSHQFQTYTFNFLNVAQLNNIVSDICINLISHGVDSGKNGCSIVITQSYFEIEYTINDGQQQPIFIKKNGVWKEYASVYKKINKKWVQVNADQVFNGMTDGEITQFVYGGEIK